MNTNSFNNRLTKVLTVAAVAVVTLVSNPINTFANGGKNDKKITLNEEQVNVQYVGSNDNSVVFRVEFENPTSEKFWLIIKNDAGDVIYRKQFSEAHFAKSVSFTKEDSDIHPTFVIRKGDNEIVRQFSVTKTIVENTVVTNL